jgi:hypothetical protein
MAKKNKIVSLDDRIDSIIESLEDLRYEYSKNICENCQGNKDDVDDYNINDEDEENE